MLPYLSDEERNIERTPFLDAFLRARVWNRHLHFLKEIGHDYMILQLSFPLSTLPISCSGGFQ
jgi:hypothetical protein